jgi:hypothetical protein
MESSNRNQKGKYDSIDGRFAKMSPPCKRFGTVAFSDGMKSPALRGGWRFNI